MKTPESIARDEWMAQAEARGFFIIVAASLRDFKPVLKARLDTAFKEGLEAGKRIERAAWERGEK